MSKNSVKKIKNSIIMEKFPEEMNKEELKKFKEKLDKIDKTNKFISFNELKAKYFKKKLKNFYLKNEKKK